MAKFEYRDDLKAEKKFNDWLTELGMVHNNLEPFADDLADTADRSLRMHKATSSGKDQLDRSEITVTEGSSGTDWFVNLDDPNAASIEFGRADYIDPDTGEHWGGMRALYILTNAARLQIKKAGRGPRLKRRKGFGTKTEGPVDD